MLKDLKTFQFKIHSETNKGQASRGFSNISAAQIHLMKSEDMMECRGHSKWITTKAYLVGGFSPPIWKICESHVKLYHFPNVWGENEKYLKPPTKKHKTGTSSH